MAEGPANPASRRIVAIVAIAAAAWFCYAGGRHALASHYAGSPEPENWLRAAKIEPDNADVWYRLGRYRQLDFDNSDLPLSVSYYQRAIQLNPSSPYYKLDFAEALEMTGKNAEADRNFRAAQAAYPISAEVSWKYGNFLLRQNRLPEAYEQIHRAVMVDPSLIPLAVSRVWRSEPDVHRLLNGVLPDTAQAYQEALSYLSDEQEASAALEVWRRLIAKDPHTELKWSFKLVDMLVAQEKYDDAGAVWHQAVNCDQAAAGGYKGNSLIYDGGFEKDIAGGGFGWRQTEIENAEFDYDSDQKHSGSRSARLIFDGEKNLQFENLYQYVPVAPDTRYRFQGFLRLESISTDSGMRFEILDPKDPQHLDQLTPNETGTEPWTLEQADFTTGPHTHLIAVRIVRRPSERLDNKLRGTVWIDDVSLAPLGDGNKEPVPAKH